MVYILFHTGIRISEFCGLTVRDVDLKNKILNIGDISVTMNTYTHLGLEDAVEEMSRMQDVENARKEQEKLAGKKEETKVSKRMFRAG